jgi:propionyl-CoA carboxylase beta chain
VRGGASNAAIHRKQIWGKPPAHEHRMQIVRLVDGSGGDGSVRSMEKPKASYIPAKSWFRRAGQGARPRYRC